MKPLRRLAGFRRRATAHALGALAELCGKVRPPQVVFLGDSITQAWSEADPALFGLSRLNRGIGGETTREMLARFDADVIALRPKAVHIMAGTNDLWHGDPGPEATIALANLRAMVRGAKEAGIGVVLAAPPPIGEQALPLFRTPALFGTLVEGVRHLAEAEGATYVDYAASLTGPDGRLIPRYTTDGVHLTRAGYCAIRVQAEEAIRRALPRS